MPLTDEAKEAARYLAKAWEEGWIGKLFEVVDVTSGAGATARRVAPGMGVLKPDKFKCPPLADLLELHEFRLIRVTETNDGGRKWGILLKQDLKDAVQNDFAQQRVTGSQVSGLARIFISYSHDDIDKRKAIEFPLARAYDDVWADDQLPGGAEWWNDILGHIAECDIFIYLLSPDSVKSKYCRSEFAEAYRLQKQILPIQIAPDIPRIPKAILWYQVTPITSGYDDKSAIIRLFADTIKRADKIQKISAEPLWRRQTPYPEKPIDVKVPARIKPKDEERELNRGILLLPGDKITISAGGRITVDNWKTRTGPKGTFADERAFRAVGRPNPEPGKENWGVVGSLIGWIGDNSLASDKAFFVGAELTKTVEEGEEGFLYLAVNDQKDAYGDNDGEFEATITVNWLNS